MFDSLIVPILTYGCELWGYSSLDIMESFHRKFLKSQLHVNTRTANCIVYGELGRFKLEIHIFRRMIGFWLKIIKSKESKLSNIFYRLLRKLYEENEYKSCWIHKIKNILDSCGMSNVWENPENFNPTWIATSVEMKLKDMGRQMWHTEIERNVLCINYRLFKTEHNFEKYILELDVQNIIPLCRFRSGCHRLPVATERYNSQENHHSCTLCNSNDIGDEYHYVLICPVIKEAREKFIKPYYYQRPSALKMKQLFNSNSIKELVNLAKYVKYIMSLF